MGTDWRFIWSIMMLKKWKEIRKCSIFLWVGREKGKRFFRRLFFCAAPRVSFKTVTERVPGRTSEACPLGEDCSGRVVRLPQGLGNHKAAKFKCLFSLYQEWLLDIFVLSITNNPKNTQQYL